MSNARDIEFPKDFPEELKDLALQERAMFEKIGQTDIYDKFITCSAMKDFWCAVKDNLPIKSRNDGTAHYTAGSVFSIFFHDIYFWHSARPKKFNKSDYNRQWKAIRNTIQKLEKLYNESEDTIKLNLNNLFSHSVQNKKVSHFVLTGGIDSQEGSFVEFMSHMRQNIDALCSKRLLDSHYDFFSTKVMTSEESLITTYFTDTFLKLTEIVFGKSSSAQIADMISEIFCEEDLAITTTYADISKRKNLSSRRCKKT